ncbi:MAG TPA: DEAD/DEAH box helicase family protein, partial [Thermoleophilia bacterium]|nr:DEAD/DEAH box helicase family protein [Thermoleophilia bacterium]
GPTRRRIPVVRWLVGVPCGRDDVLVKRGDSEGHWITVKNPESRMYGRPIFIQGRKEGGASVVAGARGLAHLRLQEQSGQKQTPEELQALEERKQTRILNAEKQAELDAKKAEFQEHWQEALGVSPELDQAEQDRVEESAREVAEKKGLEGQAVDRYAARELSAQERERRRQFRQAVRQARVQASQIVTSEDPESEAKAVAEDTELVKATAIVRGPRAKASIGEETFTIPDKAADPTEVDDKAADEPGATALCDAKERVLVQLTVEQAFEVSKLAREEKRIIPALKRELVLTPAGMGVGGLARAEQFQVALDALTDEQVRKDELDRHTRTLQAKLTSALLTDVDENWDVRAQGYSVQDGVARGALDALNGIAAKYLPEGAFIDTRVVEALGIEATAQILANRLLEKSADPAKLAQELEDLNDQHATEVGQAAEDRATELRAQSAMYLRQREDESLLTAAHANRLIQENQKEILRHLGTAAGSLQAAAATLFLVQRGKAQPTIAVSLPDKEAADELKRVLGLHSLATRETPAGVQVRIAEKQIGRFLKGQDPKSETATKLEAIARGEGGFAKDFRPSAFRDTITDKGVEKKMGLREPQRRALSWLVANEGGTVALEVGAGKTLTAFGFLGTLRDQGKAQRMLYVAPDAALQSQVIDEAAKFTTLGAKAIRGGKRDTLDAIKERYSGDEPIHVAGFQQLGQDVTALKRMGVKPGQFFRDQGYDITTIDEAHLTTTTSGGGKTGRGLRQIDTKYRVAMTGTPARKSVVEAVDLVRWTNPGQLASRASLKRKYAEVGLGTNAWHESVANDVNRMLSPYIFAGGADISAKALYHSQQVQMSDSQKQAIASVESATAIETKAARKSIQDPAQLRRKIATIEAQRSRRVYDALHDGDHETNSAIRQVRDTVGDVLKRKPDAKVLFFIDGKQSVAPLDSLQDMLTGITGGGEVVRLAAKTREGQAISKQKTRRNEERFHSDDGVRFAIATQKNAQGRNMSRADVVIHLDLADSAADEKQRNGRALRPDREGDVEVYRIAYSDSESDLRRLRQLEQTQAALRAVSNV